MATRIYYGAIPEFSIADISMFLIDGLSSIWIELTLSVLATIVYGVYTGVIVWVPPAKALPKPEEAQCKMPGPQTQSFEDVSPKVEGAPSAPSRCFRVASALFAVLAIGVGLGVLMVPTLPPTNDLASSREQNQSPSLPQPKADKDDPVAILQKQLTQPNDPAARHKVCTALGATLRAQGDLKGATAQFIQAAEAAREAKNEWGEHEAFLALASLQRRLGHFSDAEASANSALEIAKNGFPPATDLESIMKRRDSQTAKAAAWAELAQVQRDEGRLIEAQGKFKLASLNGKVDVQVAQAAYDVVLGQTDKAVQSLGEALEQNKKGPQRAEALLWLSRAQKDAGKTKKALETAQEAFAASGLSAPDIGASALLEIAGLFTELGEYDKAEARMKDAEELLAPKELDFLLADVHLAQATVFLRRGQAERCEAVVKPVLALKSAAGRERSLAATQATVLLGQSLLAQGRAEDAIEKFEVAKKNMIHFHGYFNGLKVRIQWHIAAAYKSMGKDQWAVIQRRLAIDDAITPLRGNAELSPSAATGRVLGALQMGCGKCSGLKEVSPEEHDLCVALRDVGPGDRDSGALQRRSEVLKSWGRCQGISPPASMETLGTRKYGWAP